MAFLDALRAFFSPPPSVQRSLTADQLFGSSWEAHGSTAGVSVTTESALRNVAVQAAVRLLTNDIGSLPVDAFRSQEQGKKELRKPSWVITPNPNNPNETWEDHVKQVVYAALTDGNDFTYVFPSVFDPQGISVLDPADVTIKGSGPLSETTYDVKGLGRELTPANIIHIPWMVQAGKKRGLNPIEAAKQGLGIALASDEFVGSYFGNGAILSGVIEFPPGVEPTPEQLSTIKGDFARKHVGARKSHAVGALTGGAMYKPFDYNNRDAQLLELRDQIVEEVARLFGIPPHMLGSQKPGAVGYASVEQRSIDYVTHAVLPIVRRIEVGYSRLLQGQQTYLRFNMNGLLRGDFKSRMEGHQIAVNARLQKVDEIRALEDWTPLGDNDGGGFLNTPNNQAGNPKIADLGALVRAGFDPAAAAAFLGLPPITHTGLVPVTVQGENVATDAAPQRSMPDVRVVLPETISIPPQPEPVVNVAAPIVNVPAPIVNVAAAEAPIVNVAPTDMAPITRAVAALRDDITALHTEVSRPRTRRLLTDTEGNVIGSEET